MRLFNYVSVVVMCVIVASCGKNENKPTEVKPVDVRVVKMSATPLTGTRDYSGTVEEMSGTSLSFSTAGTVKTLNIAVGQRVAKGQLIGVIDDATLRNSYQATLATLNQAQDAYNRMEQLHNKGSLPEIQWVEIQTKLQQAESAEKIAKKSLEDTKLYAPFSGVISEKSIEVGQNVLPGSPVAKLVTINNVKVKISVPENEISAITSGQKVTFTVEALGNKSFTGNVVEKGVSANPLSHSYEVKAIVNNASGELMPGMICKLQINKPDQPTALILPANTIQLDEHNRNFVWTVADGKASKRYVTIGATAPTGIVVSTGLSKGDQVIVEGQQKVSENTKINVIK